jgi:hypothetical protein
MTKIIKTEGMLAGQFVPSNTPKDNSSRRVNI